MSTYDIPYTRQKTSNGSKGWMVAIFLLAVVPIMLFHGLVLSIVWNWFIPSIFVSMPALSIGEAIGLSIVISAFIHITEKDDDKKEEEPWVRFISGLLKPFLRGLYLLALGAIVHFIVF